MFLTGSGRSISEPALQGTYLHSPEPAANLVDLRRKREVGSQRGITHNIARGQKKKGKTVTFCQREVIHMTIGKRGDHRFKKKRLKQKERKQGNLSKKAMGISLGEK